MLNEPIPATTNGGDVQERTGGHATFRILIKGPASLAEALTGNRREDQPIQQPGLREVIHEQFGDRFEPEVTCEPHGRSDFLLQLLEDRVPGELVELVGEKQFQSRLRDSPPDVLVLSLQAELTDRLLRHLPTGGLVYEDEGAARLNAGRDDLFAEVGPTEPQQFVENLAKVIANLKQRCHVIVCNCSTYDPDDPTHNYRGIEDPVAVRIQRLDLALIELSIEEGIFIIDVDSIIAEHGGERHVREAMVYSPQAQELIAREFVRVLDEIGFFENRPLIQQVGRKGALA